MSLHSDASSVGSQTARRVSAYVAVGPRLANYTLDYATESLVAGTTIDLPARLQYAWPNPLQPVLYAACADRTTGLEGNPFYLCPLLRAASGELSLAGDPVPLPSRPVHLTVDAVGRHVLTAYKGAPGLSVHNLASDGTISEEVPRADNFDFGEDPHQVRVLPSDRHAILVARGRRTPDGQALSRGALKVVRFDRGIVENVTTISPDVSSCPDGFNPRHLDFHPALPLVFVTLETQNRLCVFRMSETELEPEPLYSVTTLQDPDNIRPRQDCGTVHVHPAGRYVYVANRNDGYIGGHKGPSWLTPSPVPVFPGGENNVAIFELDESGRPVLIQNADSHGLHPRTFAMDPEARILVAANLAPSKMPKGDSLVDVPANLAIFRVGSDGRLTYLRRNPVDVGPEMIWWMGLVA